MNELFSFEKTENYEAFTAFSENNGGSVYQTSMWASVKNAWKPYYYMGYEDGKEVLSCLCLERNIPVAGKLWYCPDGFVCDLKNSELIKEFASFIKKEMKKYGVFALACDPLLVKKLNGETVDNFEESLSVFADAGFKVDGVKDFYTVQPSTTINVLLTDGEKRFTEEELLKKCEKGVRHGVRIGRDCGVKCEEYTIEDIDRDPSIADEFFSIMTETSDRVSFIQRDKSYYVNMLRSLGRYGVMDLLYYDIKGEKARAQSGIMEEKDLERFNSAMKELESAGVSPETEKIYIACGLTSYFGKTSICLYGGTRNVLRNTFRPTHLLNWVRICRSISRGCEVHDMGRITGDAYDESNPLYGLCRYKQSYAGTVTEYCGDIYLVNNSIGFFLFTKGLPFAKKMKNTVLKKMIKKRTVENS